MVGLHILNNNNITQIPRYYYSAVSILYLIHMYISTIIMLLLCIIYFYSVSYKAIFITVIKY